MITYEISRTLGWFFFRNFRMANIGLLLAGLCYSLMFYKVYRVPDGEFRRRLLWYFGTGAGYCLCCALLWHPFYNTWLQWAAACPHLYTLIHLTHYIVLGGYNNDAY